MPDNIPYTADPAENVATEELSDGSHAQLVNLRRSDSDARTLVQADDDGVLVNLGANNDVTVASLPLPTGAATSAKQDTLIGHVDGLEALLGTIDADTGILAGALADVTASGTISALNGTVSIELQGRNSVAVVVTGTFEATLRAQRSVDGGSTWLPTEIATPNGSSDFQTSTTGGYTFKLYGGETHVRFHADLYTSGTASVAFRASSRAVTFDPSVAQWGATQPASLTAIGAMDVDDATLEPIETRDAAPSGTERGLITRNIPSGTQPVSDGGGSLTVDGPLTDAQLRAVAVPVSGTFWQATQPVSGTFWQATQPVSGPLTDVQLRATAVPVSGTFWQATQPVSGPLTDAQLRAVAVPVSGTFWQATQPVSVATVPSHDVTNAGTFATQNTETRPASSAVTGVPGSATSVQLLASTPGRRAAYFYNDSAAACYVKLGTTASSSSFSVKMPANYLYELPTPVYSGRIDAIWESAVGNMRITELT